MRYRAVRYAARRLRQVCQATLKVTATLLVVSVCLMFTLRYFGVPVPSGEELLRNVAELTRVF